jgi:hypothetical protein
MKTEHVITSEMITSQFLREIGQALSVGCGKLHAERTPAPLNEVVRGCCPG